MAKIRIAHPDQNVRKALINTLKTVMPEADFDPAEGDEEAVFEGQNAPQRFKILVSNLARQVDRTKRPAVLPLGQNRLDVYAREFFTGDESVMLTEKEVDLLVYLFQRGTPATRDDLLKDVWQYASDADTHTIETHIYRLRQKIEPDAENPKILVTTKDGYQLAATAASKA